jgi:Ca2+-binding EF-hand superfamily protein
MSDIRVTVPPLEDLKAAFAKFDTESSGAIPVHDLGALLRSVGVVELKEDELQALISEEMFDKNFDLPEFLALMVEIGHTLPAPGTEKKELRKAFKQADSDGDGYLTAEELRQAMDGMAGHGPLADDEFQIMLEECRRDAEIEEGEPIKIDHAVRFFLTS